MVKVSIIVPVYNVEKYIKRCLDSLIHQTLKDIEIIIVNDGSKDTSKEIIQEYLKYENVKYYEKENGGLSSARNYGMKFANGEYIGFLDSDDFVEKDMYEIMYNKAKEKDYDMVECDFYWEFPNKIKKDKYKRPRVIAWNKIYKKNILKVDFPEGLIYEDIEFFYKLMPQINKKAYIPKYFVHYTQREDSISNKQTKKVEDIFKIIDNVIYYYKQNNLWDKYKKKLKYVFRRILLGSSLKRILKLQDTKLKKNLIKKTLKKVIKLENKNGICFGITKLGIGGAERVLVDIVNNICDKYDVTIFTIYRYGELEKEVNSKVKIKGIYSKYNKIIPIYLFLFKRIVYKKYIKNKFETEIAFLEGPITRLFSVKGNSKKIAWVHNDIKKVFGNGIKAKIKQKIDKKIYSKYDEIIFVSEDNKKSFNDLYGNLAKEKVIYNYIDKNRIIEKSKEKIDFEKPKVPVIVSVARLVEQKGIDRFIRVHKKLIENGYNHIVIIIGEGEKRKDLEDLIKELKVENTFYLIGKKENPYPYIKQADYFALLSYYEGYGMVIEEAKILEKKIIITDTAAREAVKDYPNAIIVKNNEEDIYLKLKIMLGDEK